LRRHKHLGDFRDQQILFPGKKASKRREKFLSRLAPLYGWFTEGFDTRDLKEARVLLDELHA
jgi:hypothetical protein